jgi:hypothetical protein
MNTLRFRFASTLLMAALLGASSSVSVAQEKAAAASASRTSTAATQRVPATGDSSASVRKLVCLNMSLQCFALQPAANAKSSLDLRAPEIRRIVSEEELRQPLEDEYEVQVQQEQVQVEGMRPEIYVPGGLASLPWAVMNPTQAWRIFLPVPSAK